MSRAYSRVAALYDVHGNLPALRAVLAEVAASGAELLVSGGDVLPGPLAAKALDALRAAGLPLLALRGNGERAALQLLAGETPADVPAAYRPPLEWSAQRLNAMQRAWIESWPGTVRMEITGLGPVLFCHATPASDSEIVTRETDDAAFAAPFESAGAPLVVCGHTHMQFDRVAGRVRVVNAGSVGMPFGAPGAHWLLLGPEIEFRHTPYDLAAAAEEIGASGYPGAAEFARRHVLEPPGEGEMLAAFSGGAAKASAG